MNVSQVTACQPGIYLKNISKLHQLPSKPCVLRMNTNPCSSTSISLRTKPNKPSFGLHLLPISKSREPLHVCLAGGKQMVGNNNENSPWKALEKAMEKFKGQSIEDMLQQQIEKGEYYDNGGSGVKPPGGGSDGGSDGPGESEEESFGEMLDENIQVVLATLGFILLYIYIITGEEFIKLGRDYIKYLFGGNQSARLKRTMTKWGRFYKKLTEKKEVEVDKYWLEKAILNTPTWWHDPKDYREEVRNYMKAQPEEKLF